MTSAFFALFSVFMASDTPSLILDLAMMFMHKSDEVWTWQWLCSTQGFSWLVDIECVTKYMNEIFTFRNIFALRALICRKSSISQGDTRNDAPRAVQKPSNG